ncbi:GNAT family N-acetyltransferase [uncultured Alsobacter sp.]|uniref:GNAT family N-acetyltransferase n=1 Tax=uncultured Alsobacter sp. TaxID=1748258 RepID=UPI0025FB7D57|nr:GNAT family N-acetyltransferase [uncultured Alsobacter sp.]
MQGVVIREAAPADIPAVRRVLVDTWHATYDHLFGPERVTAITDDWHAEDRLRQAIGRPGHRFLVAETEGLILATASSTLGANGRLRLDRLYVDPRVQGVGLGTGLLAAAVSNWPDLRLIDLEVEPRNGPAIAFYRRHGFVPEGAPKSGCVQEHLIMHRHLPPPGFSIRPAEPGEAEPVLAVIRAAITGTNAADYPPEAIDFMLAELSPAAISAHLVQWDVWVVTDREGTICGTGAFDGARVRQLFVTPAMQGRRLGCVLMDAIERAALDAGLERLAVRSSVTAEPFYEARGFTVLERFAWGPATMVAMERRLPAV